MKDPHDWLRRQRRQLAIMVALMCMLLVAASASGGYVWSLMRWQGAAERARATLEDDSAPLGMRRDALVIIQRNAELDMALLRKMAARGDDIGRLARVSLRNADAAGR